MLSDDILEMDDSDFKVKGYMLAALARSHKGKFGSFSETTLVYLKDAKMSGLSPEFIARELFERGVLSFVPSMLLKLITDGDYNNLLFQNQSKLIKELNLSPFEVEKTVTLQNQSEKKAKEIVREILQSNMSEAEIIQALHKIGNGEAFSKQSECLCLLSALRKLCPYNERSHCIGCKYEISTKSTMLLLTSEYKRLYSLMQKASSQLEKEKYKILLRETVVPCLDEILSCLKSLYGESVFVSYEKLIREALI
jgi:hypothetical protein